MITSFLLGSWETIVEILMLWAAYYMIYLLIKGTAAEQVFKGVIIIATVIMVTRGMNLVVMNWLLTRLLAISVIAFLIIFQPEVRRGLAKIGRFGIFTGERETINEVAKAAAILAKKKIGALIAVEREVGLRRYIESGVGIDSRVTSELINTIFSKNTPLHDGGIIISNQRVEAAACLFPLTQNPHISKTMGTRHRAALGLSEETDAVVVVVSEETGEIALAVGSKLTHNVDQKNLAHILEKVHTPKKTKKKYLSTFVRNIIAKNKVEK